MIAVYGSVRTVSVRHGQYGTVYGTVTVDGETVRVIRRDGDGRPGTVTGTVRDMDGWMAGDGAMMVTDRMDDGMGGGPGPGGLVMDDDGARWR